MGRIQLLMVKQFNVGDNGFVLIAVALQRGPWQPADSPEIQLLVAT